MVRNNICLASLVLYVFLAGAQAPDNNHYGRLARQAISSPDHLTKAVILDEKTILVIWDSPDGAWTPLRKKFQINPAVSEKIKALYGVKPIQPVNHAVRNGQTCYATVAAVLQFQLASGEMVRFAVDDLGSASQQFLYSGKKEEVTKVQEQFLVAAPDFVLTTQSSK